MNGLHSHQADPLPPLDPDMLAAVAEELSSAMSARTTFPVRAMTIVPCRIDGQALEPGTSLWVHGIEGSDLAVEWQDSKGRLARTAVVPIPVLRPAVHRLRSLDECFGAEPAQFQEIAEFPHHRCRVLRCSKHGAWFLELGRGTVAEYSRFVHLGLTSPANPEMTCRLYQAISDDMLNFLEIVTLRLQRPPLPAGPPTPGRHRFFFREECAWAFSFLADRDGCDGPHAESIGVEQRVEYVKGPYIIRIVMEAGLPPVVEMFHPVSPGGPPAVPSASGDGVSRARRIRAFRGPLPDQASWPDAMPGFLQALALQVRESEASFLDEVRAWTGGAPRAISDRRYVGNALLILCVAALAAFFFRALESSAISPKMWIGLAVVGIIAAVAVWARK